MMPFILRGLKREAIIGEFSKMHNEELRDLHSSPNIQVFKSRRMKWVGRVARMKERIGA
jgi:hypothetical protein